MRTSVPLWAPRKQRGTQLFAMALKIAPRLKTTGADAQLSFEHGEHAPAPAAGNRGERRGLERRARSHEPEPRCRRGTKLPGEQLAHLGESPALCWTKVASGLVDLRVVWNVGHRFDLGRAQWNG